MNIPITETLLPTTMVGSYPRPQWFTQQLLGRDIRVAFKEVKHEEAYHDATEVTIRDQEQAGLDIVTDGQMYFDDYVGVDRGQVRDQAAQFFSGSRPSQPRLVRVLQRR